MNNPLLNHDKLPDYSKIRPDHAESAIDHVINEGRQKIQALLDKDEFTWQGFAQPFEDIHDRVSKIWSPLTHLNAVVNTAELREAYNVCLKKISEYHTDLGQNKALFDAYSAVSKEDLDLAQRKLVEHALRDFHLAGVDLPSKEKARFKEIQSRLSVLGAKFSENVLDATNSWSKHVTDPQILSGIPQHAQHLAKDEAQKRQEKGWRLILDYPNYHAILSHADDRDLRKEFYSAWITRASDRGPNANRWDNTPLMSEILSLRLEKAKLLSFENYADLSLATKMASSVDAVLNFLNDLAIRSKPQAKREFAELTAFAKTMSNIDELKPWDIAYFSEKQKQSLFNLSDEQLRPYFPLPKVCEGMFVIARKLYGINVISKPFAGTWHKDVRFFEVQAESGERIGNFFVDIYARPHKRGGAWMDDCLSRKNFDELQHPVAQLVCNFMPPVGDESALLTHNEVLTLFHEFGHCLHHLLTQVDYPSVAGIAGVAWDAVELPSQFMENFAWEEETLPLISGHYQTDAPIPSDMFHKLLEARVFQSAMQMVRQLEFALFDFKIHSEDGEPSPAFIQGILDEVRNQVAVTPKVDFSRFSHSFSHIFSGGYAAGYYSYKWAEVLSADAFSAFEESGILDRTTGKRFEQAILAVGGTEDAMNAFVNFRGREPKVDALLRHSGMSD